MCWAMECLWNMKVCDYEESLTLFVIATCGKGLKVLKEAVAKFYAMIQSQMYLK